jgi:hypothetical protein
MGIKRSVVGLVTMAVAATAVAVVQPTATPNMYYDMPTTKVARSIVTADSATTSTAPQMYYD